MAFKWSKLKEVADKGQIILEMCRVLNTVDSDALKAEEGYCWISVINLERVGEVHMLSLSEVTRIIEGLVLDLLESLAIALDPNIGVLKGESHN